MERKNEGAVGTRFKNEPENHRMLVSLILACKQLLIFRR